MAENERETMRPGDPMRCYADATVRAYQTQRRTKEMYGYPQLKTLANRMVLVFLAGATDDYEPDKAAFDAAYQDLLALREAEANERGTSEVVGQVMRMLAAIAAEAMINADTDGKAGARRDLQREILRLELENGRAE
jgi:hypothetical protein